MSPRADLTPQEWFTAAQLADMNLPGLASTKRGVQLIADREGWATVVDTSGHKLSRPRKARGGGTEYHLSLLPEAARAKLSKARPAGAEKLDRESALLRWERLPQTLKDEAARRLGVIQAVEDMQRLGLVKNKAIEFVVRDANLRARAEGRKGEASDRTVHAWFERIRGVAPHDRLAYLAPNHSGRVAVAEIPTEAWERYKTEWLCNEETTFAQCYRLIQDLAPSREWTLPSPKTFERRIHVEIPASLIIRRREGAEAARHTYPHADRVKPEFPMQVINLDGHTHDFEIQWEDGRRGRPVTLLVQDIASGMPLAWRHAPTLSHHSVRLALGDTFREFGVCDVLLMDNGSENQHRFISGGIPRLNKKVVDQEPWGLLKSLGVRAQFAQPYWGQAKPVERVFRDFAHDLAKHPAFEGAYVGNAPGAKPANYRSKVVPEKVFREVVDTWLIKYRQRLGRSGVGMNGRSFQQVFEEGIVGRALKKLTEEQLAMCMLTSLPRPMDRVTGEVSILDHRYWSPELGDLKRRPVMVRFDPDNLALPVRVYDTAGKFLCLAERTQQGSFDKMEDAARLAKLKRDYLKKQREADERLTTYTRADNAAALAALTRPVEPIAEPDTNIVRPAFRAARRSSAAAEAFDFSEQQDRAFLARFPGGS